MDYRFTISAKDTKPKGDKYPTDAPYTSTGQLYDLLAVAVTGQDSNDMDNFEAYDAAIDYTLNEYDFEAAYIAALNAIGDDYAKILTLTGNRVSSPAVDLAEKAGLMFGAWYALNMPDMFALSLAEWIEAQKDAAHDCLGGYAGREGLSEDLAKELDRAYDVTSDDFMHEYLHGDGGRNWNGVYTEAERKLFSDLEISLDQNDNDRRKNVLHVTLTEDDARRLVEEVEGIDLTKARIGIDRVKTAVIDRIVYAAKREHDKRQAQTIKRREERAKVQAYQEVHAKEEAKAKRIKLEAMTR